MKIFADLWNEYLLFPSSYWIEMSTNCWFVSSFWFIYQPNWCSVHQSLNSSAHSEEAPGGEGQGSQATSSKWAPTVRSRDLKCWALTDEQTAQIAEKVVHAHLLLDRDEVGEIRGAQEAECKIR